MYNVIKYLMMLFIVQNMINVLTCRSAKNPMANLNGC